jgi:hypothetical protein
VIFVAAVAEGPVQVPSDVPFLIASNGAAVGSAFQWAKGFGVAVIGPDGNVDLQTEKVTAGPRLRDVIQNSVTVQAASRKRMKEER